MPREHHHVRCWLSANGHALVVGCLSAATDVNLQIVSDDLDGFRRHQVDRNHAPGVQIFCNDAKPRERLVRRDVRGALDGLNRHLRFVPLRRMNRDDTWERDHSFFPNLQRDLDRAAIEDDALCGVPTDGDLRCHCIGKPAAGCSGRALGLRFGRSGQGLGGNVGSSCGRSKVDSLA